MSTSDQRAERASGARSLTFRLTPQGFVSADGRQSRYIHVECKETRRDWLQKQEASMPEYLQELNQVNPLIDTLYRLFDRYIAAALHGRRNARVLDVGCGLNRAWPPYVATLKREHARTGILYAGLDPIAHDIEQRDYPFACARLEDLHTVLDDRFDVFVFATSLDHFEQLDEVARAVRGLAAENAVCIFWVGLHDPILVGEQIGARAYRRLFSSLAPLGFVWRYARTMASMAVNYLRLLRRRSRSRRNLPLDDLHFHYFTEESLARTLLRFGPCIDRLIVPGTSSVFATVRVDTAGDHAH